MRNLDKLIVRILPFILYIILGVEIVLCWNGVDISLVNLLHGNSALYATALFLISLSNKRYHCKYNRYMYVLLIAAPVINFLDGVFNIFPIVDTYLIAISVLYFVVAFITAFRAIKHFIKVNINKIYGRE